MKRMLLAVACAFAASSALAQSFPSKAMTVVVPNPPGGMNQIHAQPLSAIIERLTKQPAPVVNRSGGTAAVGTAFVANQPADGHTLLVTTPNLYLVIEKDKLYGIKSPYTLAQIQPVALMSADPLIMVTHPSVPVKTAKEFAALLKKKTGVYTFSSSGPYGITHVPFEMFIDSVGIKMRHVPTTGGGPAITQALGGHVDATASGAAAIHPPTVPSPPPGRHLEVHQRRELLGLHEDRDHAHSIIAATSRSRCGRRRLAPSSRKAQGGPASM